MIHDLSYPYTLVLLLFFVPAGPDYIFLPPHPPAVVLSLTMWQLEEKFYDLRKELKVKHVERLCDYGEAIAERENLSFSAYGRFDLNNVRGPRLDGLAIDIRPLW